MHRRACHTRPCCVPDVAGYTTGRAGTRLIYVLNLRFLFSFPSSMFPSFYFYFSLNSWIVVGMSWFQNIGSIPSFCLILGFSSDHLTQLECPLWSTSHGTSIRSTYMNTSNHKLKNSKLLNQRLQFFYFNLV